MALSEIYADKQIIITGDTGFKGSWLALWLHSLGAMVTGIGLAPKTSRDNYVACGLESVITHYSCDIRHYDRILEIFSATEPEMVFHLAAQPLVPESYITPRETFEINTQGTANILEAIRRTPSVQAGVMVTSDKCYENREWIYGYGKPILSAGMIRIALQKVLQKLSYRHISGHFFQQTILPQLLQYVPAT